MTKKSFLDTSGDPDFKIQVLGPTRIPAFPEICLPPQRTPEKLVAYVYTSPIHKPRLTNG